MKNLQKTKYIILGMLLMALLSNLLFPALAAAVTKKVDIVFNNIKVYANGNLMEPKDAKGDALEAFNYNGNIYYPIRTIATAVDLSCEYDGATGSYYIGKKPDGTGAKKWLSELTPTGSKYATASTYEATSKQCRELTSSDSDNYENKYTNGQVYSLSNSMGWIYNEYAVDMKYSTVSGTIALANSTKNTNERVVIEVEGRADGVYKVLYTSPVITSSKRPVDFNVDISGWSDIRISVNACDKDGNRIKSNGYSHQVSGNISIILGNVALN